MTVPDIAAARVHIMSPAAIPRAGPEAATTSATASLIASLAINEASISPAKPLARVVLPEPGNPLTRSRSTTGR